MLRMVAVNWNGNPPYIEVVGEELHPERGTNGRMLFCAANYPRIRNDGEFLYAQVGVGDATDVRYAKDGRSLRRVESVVDGKSWWVEDQGEFTSYRTAGTLALLVDGVEYEIEVRPSELSPAEFQELVDDFSGTLWSIILAGESYVALPHVRDAGDYCAEWIRRLERFVRAVRNVLAAPTRTLKSVIAVDRPGKIRPIAATYVHRLYRPAARRLPGRSQVESFDTAENRYLLWLCLRAKEIAAGCELAALCKFRELNEFISKGRSQIETMDGTELVALADVREGIEGEERRIAQWTLRKEHWLKLQPQALISGFELEIEFSGPSNPSIWNGVFRCSTEECEILLPEVLWTNHVVEPRQWYRVRGLFACDSGEHRAVPVYRAVALRALDVVTPQPLTRYREYEAMAGEGAETLRVPLEDLSRREQQEEREALCARVSAMESASKHWRTHSREARRLHAELGSLAARLRRELGVRSSFKQPSSVVYLRNPRYARVLAAYRALIADQAAPIDQLLQAAKSGVLSVPALYERWCLVRVMRALLGLGYRSIQGGWISTLVRALGENPDPFAQATLWLCNHDAQRSIEVQYQGYRKHPDLGPADIVLVIRSLAGDAGQSWLLVLDPKYKPLEDELRSPNKNHAGMSIQREVKEMLDKYGGEHTFVFIVHPSEKAIRGPKNRPVRFTSRLGGGKVIHTEDRPNHRYGAIFAKPGAIDGLHAAIGMVLQYSIEENSGAFDSKPLHQQFCLVCGSTRIKMIYASVETKGIWWKCDEPDCGHRYIQHFCHCGNRIWKHGVYWTYHETLLGDSYNIRCPECGKVYVVS